MYTVVYSVQKYAAQGYCLTLNPQASNFSLAVAAYLSCFSSTEFVLCQYYSICLVSVVQYMSCVGSTKFVLCQYYSICLVSVVEYLGSVLVTTLWDPPPPSKVCETPSKGR